MEKFKGTLGSWTMRMTGKVNNSNAYMIAIDCLTNGCGIEQMSTVWAWDEKDEVSISNAQLIASAPLLLQVLQYILQNDDGFGILLGYKSREMAEQAINKALGHPIN